MDTSSIHSTPVFKPYSTAPSGCSSAPDRPTVHEYMALVHWLSHFWFNGYFSPCEWPNDPTPAQGDHQFIRRYYFQENFSNG
jgi:hypothetical protein